MVFLTGDIHGRADRLEETARPILTKEDVLILLGDVGANYFRDWRDRYTKTCLGAIKATVLCIHGNHEARPHTVSSYKEKVWNGGIVWYEEEFPNLLFAKDGEIFEIEGLRYLALGGAYSVDKEYRLARGYKWWSDEQPSDEIKVYVNQRIASKKVDIVLSHTCPLRYIPIEMFLPGVNQSKVDQSTEEWLGEIESQIDYKAWFCGHWHTNKKVDRMHFLFNEWEHIDGTFAQ